MQCTISSLAQKSHAPLLFVARLNQRPVQRYVLELTEDIGENVTKLTVALSTFSSNGERVVPLESEQDQNAFGPGIPAIRHEHRRDSENLLNMSTVATFFSAVTATTLQMALSAPRGPLLSIVNTFWFCSLVFSIGSALNSLLAVAWKRTP